MLRNLALHLPAEPIHLWAVFVIMIAFFIIISAMFIFHWTYYGVGENPRIFVKGLYFTIGIIILFLALTFLTLYSAT